VTLDFELSYFFNELERGELPPRVGKSCEKISWHPRED